MYGRCSALLIALVALSVISKAAAQWSQTFTSRRITNPVTNVVYDGFAYLPAPDRAARPRSVIDLGDTAVYLYYNCYYMTNICQNVKNFRATPRGQDRHPGTNIPANVYTYDFDTAKVVTGEPPSRASKRRDASCPTPQWKNTHPCPEAVNQHTLYRHDGPWFTTDLEPGTEINMVKHKRGPKGDVIEYSNIRHTCDEFPPASWVEGGNGWLADSPANTTCAGMPCYDPASVVRPDHVRTDSVKAEQYWQGAAHGLLRDLLLSEINTRKSEFPWFDKAHPERDVAFFRFEIADHHDNGVAAAVLVSDGPTRSDRNEQIVTQAKRAEVGSNHTVLVDDGADEPATRPRRLLAPSFEEVYQQTLARGGRRFDVRAGFNGSSMPLPGSEGPKITGMASGDREPALPKRQAVTNSSKPLLQGASSDDLAKARQIVTDAIAASAKLNRARLDSPARNQYRLKPGTVTGQQKTEGLGTWYSGTAGTKLEGDEVDARATPPLLDITDEIARAAALVAEADPVIEDVGTVPPPSSNVTRRAPARGTFWMETIARKGTVPWGRDPTYQVFRNVLDYGAVGNGVVDDTAAIKQAMNDGRRCGEKCNGSTVKNAIVYFPPGTYLISSTVPLPFGTQVIGDANSRPLLVASSSFIGLGVLSTSEYTGGGKGIDELDQQWFVNTANFYRQIRNIIIDVRNAPRSEITACLHYQVAQATSLQNVELRAGPGSKGLFAENGSGGQISDVVFKGGDVGLYGGNQQFTAQRLVFDGCSIGVHVIWDWGWVWKSITMTNVVTGFRFVPNTDNGNKADGHIGSASIMDSSFTGVTTAVIIAPPSTQAGTRSTGLVLDNVKLSGVRTTVADTNGKSLLDGSDSRIEQWVLGPVYSGSADPASRTFYNGGKVGTYRRQGVLVDQQGNYFERPKPQYEGRGVGDFVHVKDFGAIGDGVTDDTAAFQLALSSSQGKVLFVDAGSYILTKTVTVPTGSKIVGETWSQLVAYGPNFADAAKPMVMLRVGSPHQVGNVEMQDLIFTTKGPTAGAVLVEWNMAADAQGSAGLWDCHVRIGGATGTDLTPAECPALTAGYPPKCNAGSLMMHLKPGASGYFENMWLWVADHIIDDGDLNDANNTMVQNSIYVARGLLIESTEATWLYGTASEHAVFYQYNFHHAENIFAGMIQTESPYYQPNPNPPAPFSNVVGGFPGDPDYSCTAGDFDGCDQAWAVIMQGCEDILVAGAGLYSWFSTYTQGCLEPGKTCQKALLLLKGNHASVRFQNLVTIGAKYMAVMEGKGISAKDNMYVDMKPWWSQISVLDVASDGPQFNDILWLPADIWDMPQPEFSCVPPCRVRIPPYTGATTTVNYPMITVSKDAWTSTITVRPMTMSELGFEVMTFGNGGSGNKKRLARQATFGDFWPVPAHTTGWPVVVYNGPDGSESIASPTAAFPSPPTAIGPGAAPPAKGSWPAVPIRARAAAALDPNKVLENGGCQWICRQASRGGGPSFDSMAWDCGCPDKYKSNFTDQNPDWPGRGWRTPAVTFNGTMPTLPQAQHENDDAPLLVCELPETTKSTTLSPTATAPTRPTVTPPKLKHADAIKNDVHCFNSGQPMDNVFLRTSRRSFCDRMAADLGFYKSQATGLGPRADIVIKGPYKKEWDIPLPVNKVAYSFEVFDGCEWTFNQAECERYLSTPVDSCNCDGENWKQGGWGQNNCLTWKSDPQYVF